MKRATRVEDQELVFERVARELTLLAALCAGAQALQLAEKLDEAAKSARLILLALERQRLKENAGAP